MVMLAKSEHTRLGLGPAGIFIGGKQGNMINELVNMDCLEWLKALETASVDMLLSDPPYGTTHCHWDKPLQWEDYAIYFGKHVTYNEYMMLQYRNGENSDMTWEKANRFWRLNKQPGIWSEIKRVVKPNGAILLFSAQPFTTDLINSNRRMFRYEIIWEKTQVAGFLNAKRMPLRTHENILVFYQSLPTYNPIKSRVERTDVGRTRNSSHGATQYQPYHRDDYAYVETGERYPTDVIKFSSWNGALFGKTENATKHPTQKPVDLLEYLIQTYTNEGDKVIDMCAGSNSTGIACYNTKREYAGCEKDREIYAVAQDRTRTHMSQLALANC